MHESAVVGVKDDKWGERPMAYVVCKPGATLDVETIRNRLLDHVEAKRISKYAVPDAERIVFVGEIPKTSVGKINKKVLRERMA